MRRRKQGALGSRGMCVRMDEWAEFVAVFVRKLRAESLGKELEEY
jgi:hypothetical protein